MVLAGLRWSQLALGDMVSFEMSTVVSADPAWWHSLKGPYTRRGDHGTSILGKTGDDRALDTTTADGRTPWVVVGMQTDWLAGRVTLELSKHGPHSLQGYP